MALDVSHQMDTERGSGTPIAGHLSFAVKDFQKCFVDMRAHSCQSLECLISHRLRLYQNLGENKTHSILGLR